jgi:two-component system, cell cycle sensor histidine kinase and response regulator CckA
MDDDKQGIRVFFLEDNPDDVELELYELRKAGFNVIHEVARNRKEFLQKLTGFPMDIMLADYSLPDITGLDAISLCKDKGLDVPVILITGEGNEMMAVDSLRLGAIDYIIKKNIAGLPARVKRALEIWSDHKAKEHADEDRRRLQQLLFENQKMDAIGRLAGGIAHDFNNILTGIIGFSEFCINDHEKGLSIREKLQSIMTLSLRGSDLVKQLLIFSRKMPVQLKVLDFNSFIIETMQFLNRIVEETMEIKIDLHEDVLKVKCDAGQFTQVLMNLTLNARDAMNGKGRMTIKTGKSYLPEDLQSLSASAGKEEYVYLTVSDTGVGINSDDIQKIFDPFFTTKELGKGTGLGLSIVYSVVNAHKGFIKVSSEKAEGAAFKIYLPCAESAETDDGSQFFKTPQVSDAKKLHGKETVLVAEDEAMIRELVVSIMKSFGYKVITAKDGEEAFNIYSSGEHKIDMVVSDMMMPNKGGIQLFKELKAINPDLKFILVTGYSLADQDEAVIGSMDAVLAKPYTPMKIMQLARDILDKKNVSRVPCPGAARIRP